MTTLNIGLLGAGRIGKVHGAAISETAGARLAAVADAFPEPANELADMYDAEVCSIEEIMDDASIHAVFITTPTDMHADLIEDAARRGKRIFCEKPIDLSVERVRECLAVVAEHDATLMVGFNRRFDPNFKQVRDHIDSGAIGDVEMVNIISRDPGPPPLSYMERSGGLFKDMTIHDFDMARFLLGEEPVAVTAVGSVLVDPAIATVPDIDSAAVTLVTTLAASAASFRRADALESPRPPSSSAAARPRAASQATRAMKLAQSHSAIICATRPRRAMARPTSICRETTTRTGAESPRKEYGQASPSSSSAPKAQVRRCRGPMQTIAPARRKTSLITGPRTQDTSRLALYMTALQTASACTATIGL